MTKLHEMKTYCCLKNDKNDKNLKEEYIAVNYTYCCKK